MRSIGNDLAPLLENGKLRIQAARSSLHGLEMHLASMADAVREFKPSLVVLDPISNFIAAGTTTEVKGMLTRLIDMLKDANITGVFTSLTFGGSALEQTETTISSLMDTWILVRAFEGDGERNRGLMILKARGTAHSNQVREFVMSDNGIELVDVYLGGEGVLMGSARVGRESKQDQADEDRQRERDERLRLLEQKRLATEAQIKLLQASLEAEAADILRIRQGDESRSVVESTTRKRLASMRTADAAGPTNHAKSRRKPS
jgi:circadian clock protein KaiC